jgi:protein TonB
MLGLSDSSVGVVTSVLIHLGVAAAFLGPFGSGNGPQDRVVMVTIEGVDPTVEQGEQPTRKEISIPDRNHPKAPSEPVQVKKQESAKVTTAKPQKARQDPPEELKKALEADQASSKGGWGLVPPLYSQPVISFFPKPPYPSLARRQAIEGRVELAISVSPEGTVNDATVAKSSGSEALDQAAVSSSYEAKFQPALRAGVPTAAQKNVVVTFSLVE